MISSPTQQHTFISQYKSSYLWAFSHFKLIHVRVSECIFRKEISEIYRSVSPSPMCKTRTQFKLKICSISDLHCIGSFPSAADALIAHCTESVSNSNLSKELLRARLDWSAVQQLQSSSGRRDINLCHKMQLLHLFAECTSKKKEKGRLSEMAHTLDGWAINNETESNWFRVTHQSALAINSLGFRITQHSSSLLTWCNVKCMRWPQLGLKEYGRRKDREEIVKSHTDGKQKRSSVIKND